MGTLSVGNILCVVIAFGLLAFHTFLFANLSGQLEKSLKRIDDLERLLKNQTTAGTSTETTTIASKCAEELQMRLDSELSNADSDVKELRVLRKIHRLEKRIEKCMLRSYRSKRYIESGRTRRSGNSEKKKYALFTVWGVSECTAKSEKVHIGQMVTTDGSDYVCLGNSAVGPPVRRNRTRGRNLGSDVKLRGVTYGDIEDVLNFFTIIPPSGNNTRNNRTVPCALCAREGKSSSKMIIARPSQIRKFYAQREYIGVLMSSKESKKLICLSVDARKYENDNIAKTISSRFPLSNTVKLHPAELRCNTMYCEADRDNYKERHRVGCMVVTF